MIDLMAAVIATPTVIRGEFCLGEDMLQAILTMATGL